MKQIHVANDGQDIEGSTFWDTLYACRGYFFLTFNQGAARLLIPDNRISDVEEMKTGKLVIISQGPWAQSKRKLMNEILFDDGTETPYSIHFGMEQTDRKLPATDHGRDVPFSAWGRNAVKLFERPGKIRLNKKIPCLEAWEKVIWRCRASVIASTPTAGSSGLGTKSVHRPDVVEMIKRRPHVTKNGADPSRSVVLSRLMM